MATNNLDRFSQGAPDPGVTDYIGEECPWCKSEQAVVKIGDHAYCQGCLDIYAQEIYAAEGVDEE